MNTLRRKNPTKDKEASISENIILRTSQHDNFAISLNIFTCIHTDFKQDNFKLLWNH